MANEDEPKGTGASEEAPAATTSEGGDQGPNASEVVASLGIADVLKQSFAEYIADKEVVAQGDDPQLNLDWEFIRDHGGPLVAHMFQQVTRQLLAESLRFSVPAPKAAPGDEGKEGKDAAKPGVNINFNFDLGDFLGKLFRGPQDEPPKER